MLLSFVKSFAPSGPVLSIVNSGLKKYQCHVGMQLVHWQKSSRCWSWMFGHNGPLRIRCVVCIQLFFLHYISVNTLKGMLLTIVKRLIAMLLNTKNFSNMSSPPKNGMLLFWLPGGWELSVMPQWKCQWWNTPHSCQYIPFSKDFRTILPSNSLSFLKQPWKKSAMLYWLLIAN